MVTQNLNNNPTSLRTRIRQFALLSLTVAVTALMPASTHAGEWSFDLSDSNTERLAWKTEKLFSSAENHYLTETNTSIFTNRASAGASDLYRWSRAPDQVFAEAQKSWITQFAASKTTDSTDIQSRLTRRYQNPQVLRFLSSLNSQESMNLYKDISNLIDTRHLAPSTYRVRTQRALTNLIHAVENPVFRQTNRISASAQKTEEFQRLLSLVMNDDRIRTSQDAQNVMSWTMNIAHQQLNLNPTVVANEFVYGATESLDKYSAFVPPEKNEGPRASLDDHVVGIGVSVESHEMGLMIVKVLPGGPAAEAGLRKGDLIMTINGQPLKGWNLDRSVDLIAGQSGTQIRLGIKRENFQTSPLTLVRRYVPISSISDVQMVDREAKIGYLKLDQFAKKSSEELDKALWQLHRSGMKSLIFDVRGNPGGLLTTAIELSNKFIPCGSIVSTRGRMPQDNSRENATYERTWKVPLVVLIDGNSASASEIFAAAIQENGRGLVVGQRSYGKGTVQTQFPLQRFSASLRLTTAKFYSPNGREMAGAGVTPDQAVAKSTESQSTFESNPSLQKAMELARGARVKEMAMAKSSCRFHHGMPHPLQS